MSLFEILTYILIFVLLSSAIFSASETAFAVSNSMRLSKAAASGRKSAKLAEYIDKNFVRSISTILVGNNLVNIAASSAFTVLFISYFGNNKGTVLAMIVSTVVILIFGEIMPKIIANEYADSLVYILAYPIRFFMIVFSPVVRVVAAIVRRYEKYWTPKDNGQASVKPEELVTMLETIEEEGVITEKEKELIKSAIEFPT